MSQPGGTDGSRSPANVPTGQVAPPEARQQSWPTPQQQPSPSMQYPHSVQGTSAVDVNQQHYQQPQTPLQHFQRQQQATQYFKQPQVTPPQQHYQQQQTYQQHQFPQQQVVEQFPHRQVAEGTSPGTYRIEEATDEPVTPGLKGTLQNLSLRFTSPSAHTEDKPNVGFTPTPAMVKKHEQATRSEPSRPMYQFQVTKLRTWRTGYVRLLRLNRDNFCTIDPDTHEVTNTWSYNALTDWLAIPKEKDCVLLQVGVDKLKLKCHNVDRSILLTALLESKIDVEGPSAENYPLFRSCARQTRHGTRVAMSLKVAAHGLIELNPTTQMTLQTYRYVDITAVSFTSDDTSGIVLHMPSYKSRIFFVESSRRNGNGRSDLLTAMREHCDALGLELRMTESCKLTSWIERRRMLGNSAGAIFTSWDVTKTTRRHDAALVGHDNGWMRGTVSRRLAVTGKGLLLEMDGSGVVSCRRLGDLHALVRHPHADTVTIEFKNGSSRTYASANRDAFLVSLLDAASFLSNNVSVHVSDVTSGGYCLSSLDNTPEAPPPTSTASIIFQSISIPVHCLKRVHAVSTAAYAFLTHGTESSFREGEKIKVAEECAIVVEACREFDASVSPTGEGLPKSPTDRFVLGSIGALWGILAHLLQKSPSDPTNIHDWHEAERAATPMFQALYRLTQTPAGYKGTAELDTMQECIGLLWELDDSFCQFWMLRVLRVLLSGSAKRDKEVEFVNKSVVLRTGGTAMVDGLVATMLDAVSTQPGGQRAVSDLILFVTSDILQSVLCSDHDTTSPEHFADFIRALANGHRALLSALRSPTPFVIENTALLLHLLSTHDPSTSDAIREAALGSGILLQHFHAAIFSPLEGQRFLSRYLCSLWLSGPMDCGEKRLLKRMVPSGFLGYLNMPILSQMEEEQLDELERDASSESRLSSRQGDYNVGEGGSVAASGAAGTNTARLRSRITLALQTTPGSLQKTTPENFRIFFHVLTKDHALADLIWNQQTRQELRMALENEIQSINRVTESRGGIDRVAWNHQQFTVEYPSLDNEVKVGTVYMRLWLQAGDGFIKSWEEPYRLFELLFRRFLCELDRNTTVTNMCIRCLERLYSIHANMIGPFSDIMILVHSMASTKNTETQHRLLGLVATLLGVSADEDRHGKISIPENAEQLLNVESIGQLCQFVAWGHTNGEEVGNLLSTMLGEAERRRTMITDGTSVGPQGIQNGASPETELASDRFCPPVWFISSTGRTPPPPESIRGPFRVSELMSMIQKGSLSPYDQVTASHVEDYNEEEPEPDSGDSASSSVKDAHIDTGKWRRINQVWQLRWQLCADGSSSGIFGPNEVALLALRTLTRLVDLHKSLDSRGVPYFPVPIAKRLLCGLSRETSRGASDFDVDQSDIFLPILSQSLLCNDHRVVATGAELLHKLILHNEDAVSKFYLTGVFLFALNYTGNNFRPLAELLNATHLKQHFRSGFAAVANDSELSLKDRSILGNMLPDGLLFILVNYGVERFTEIFVGNFDTPEVIWNLEMRKHLVEMIRQHLGDFPKRLWQNTTARFEYCPIPGIAYKRLEKEVLCHNYYLNNLCDDIRFPDWPIAEPVDVFRACLEEWKLQLRRDAVKEEDAQEEARKVLSLKSGDGSKQLRKAYRGLARKYHPDKNPAGREMFEAIQDAYELLLPVVESGGKITAKSSTDATATDEDAETPGRQFSMNVSEGLGGGLPQMQTMHLLIRTQLLICKRYADDMSKYKYPAYRMLLECLLIPVSCRDFDMDTDFDSFAGCCLMMTERAEFVRTAADLVYHTCLVSPLNAEELIAEGGLPILESLLDFYVNCAHFVCDSSVMQRLPKEKSDPMASEALIMDILSNLVHTLSGVAFFESGRRGILKFVEDPKRLSVNWRRCLECKFKGVVCVAQGTAAMKRFALEGIANMAKALELQDILVGSGVMWPLIRNMLNYDPTLEGSFSEGEEVANISQATTNELGRLSARALGMLSGVMMDAALVTPENKEVQRVLNKLLTAPIARMLRNKLTIEILRTLNTNVETPVRIWNVGMRKELSAFISKMENERPDGPCRSVADELEPVMTSFEFTVLKNEITVGGVYLRVFNAMGGGREALREIADASEFATHILGFIAMCMNQSTELGDRWIKLPNSTMLAKFSKEEATNLSISDKRFNMAVMALSHLVRVDGLVDDVLCDSSKQPTAVLLSLLELPQDTEAFGMSCDILTVLSPKQPFADAVAQQDSLWRLLWVLERPDENEKDLSSNTLLSTSRLQRGWELLESLSSSSSIAMKLVHSSGWLELLGIIAGYEIFTKRFVSRLGAAKTLSRLLWDTNTGPLTGSLLERFLPPTLAVVLKEVGPDTMLKVFDKDHETPELIWNGIMRGELRAALAEQLDSCVKGRTEPDAETRDFRLSPDAGAKYKHLEGELYIGGVYVRLFLKEPTFNLRDPTSFLEKLLIRWIHELEVYTSSNKKKGGINEPSASSGAVTAAKQDALLLVTSASIYLCKVRESLCDKLAQWGYMARSLAMMHEVLACELIGAPLLSIMRILHVASNRLVNVEALAIAGDSNGKGGIVYYTLQAFGRDPLHTDCAFMVEVLLKVFRKALGDVKNAPKTVMPSPSMPSGMEGPQMQGSGHPASSAQQRFQYTPTANAMAPSPAPGLEPVRKSAGKARIEHPLDHPLAFGGDNVPTNNQATAPSRGARSGGNRHSTASRHDHPLAPALAAANQPAIHRLSQPGMQAAGHYGSSQSRQDFSNFQSQVAPSPVQQSQAHYGSSQLGQSFASLQNPLAPAPVQQLHVPNPYVQGGGLPSGDYGQLHIAQTQLAAHSVGGQYTQRSGMQQATTQQGDQMFLPTQQQAQPQYQPTPVQPTYGSEGTVHSAQFAASSQGMRPTNMQFVPGQASGAQGVMQSLAPFPGGEHYSQSGGMEQATSTIFSSTQYQTQAPSQSAPVLPGKVQLPENASFLQGRPSNIVQCAQGQASVVQPAPVSGGEQYSQSGGIQQPTVQHTRNHFLSHSQQQEQISDEPSLVHPSFGTKGPVQSSQPLTFLQGDEKLASGQPMASSPAPTPQYRPTPIEGGGIDARSSITPKQKAEQLILSSAGAPGSAQGRIALLESALVCELPKVLVELVLENPSLPKVKDPAATKVHSVELLKLLTMDPGYGLKFQLILKEIPAWKKYKSQDHSLFITGAEQKADYFLTDGDKEPAKLLTEG